MPTAREEIKGEERNGREEARYLERRRRGARTAARLWGELTLGGIVVLAALTIWHLIRRGRMLRDRNGPPRG